MCDFTAMVTGVSFLELPFTDLLASVTVIAVITFLVSAVAVWLGSLVGNRYGRVAERVGGTVLILIGLKILLEGLGYWPF